MFATVLCEGALRVRVLALKYIFDIQKRGLMFVETLFFNKIESLRLCIFFLYSFRKNSSETNCDINDPDHD